MPTRKSNLFRELVSFYRQKTLEDELFRIQKYGTKKAREMKLTENDNEQPCGRDRRVSKTPPPLTGGDYKVTLWQDHRESTFIERFVFEDR